MNGKRKLIGCAAIGFLLAFTAQARAQENEMRFQGGHEWRAGAFSRPNVTIARPNANPNLSRPQGVISRSDGKRTRHEGNVIRRNKSVSDHGKQASRGRRAEWRDRDFDHGRGRRFPHRSTVIFYNAYPYYPYYYRGRPLYNNDTLSISEIINMESRGLTDEEIINEIRDTRTVFKLSSADVVYLRNSGVSDRVIDFMLETGRPGYLYSSAGY